MKYFRNFKSNSINTYILFAIIGLLYNCAIGANEKNNPKPKAFFDQEAIKFTADQNKLIIALNKKDTAEVEACFTRMELAILMMQNTVTPNRSIVLFQLTEELMVTKALIAKKNK